MPNAGAVIKVASADRACHLKAMVECPVVLEVTVAAIRLLALSGVSPAQVDLVTLVTALVATRAKERSATWGYGCQTTVSIQKLLAFPLHHFLSNVSG